MTANSISNLPSISTEITRIFNIKYPIFLAGMNIAAGPKLAATVTNYGGLGVIGGLNYTPKFLRMMIKELKNELIDKNAPFGVDLLLPKIGNGARKTNYDYTKGLLNELIDVIIEEEAKLFVTAVGIPPKDIVEKLHSKGIFVMNIVGSPKHVKKALNVGVDIICAQGSEGGGHTGDIGTMVLVPAIVNECLGYESPLTGRQVQVIAAGGIYDGRTLAAALCLGASAVWIGTRFVASIEANASDVHKRAVLQTSHDDTMKTLVFTGRPLRIADNYYARDWEKHRRTKMESLLEKGIVPSDYDLKNITESTIPPEDLEFVMKFHNKEKPYPHLLGQVAGSIYDIKYARDIIKDIMLGFTHALAEFNEKVNVLPRSSL